MDAIRCKEYTKYTDERQLVLPLETEFLIPKDEPVRLLDQVLEELDYTKLYLTYSEKGRNPSADPRSLFKVLAYAYSQSIFSSRKIEEACIYDFGTIIFCKVKKPRIITRSIDSEKTIFREKSWKTCFSSSMKC